MAEHDTIALSGPNRPGHSQVETIPRELGPVRLLREIGRGAMGVVYLGRHQLLRRDVAVKFLPGILDHGPAARDVNLFLGGAAAVAAIRHPHLTAIHHADVVQGVPYLILDYIEGSTLAEVLGKTRPLTVDEFAYVMDGLCSGLAALHEQGVIHRDIKPSNVLVDRSGLIFLADFGLACLGSTDRRAAGTPVYMAPEVFDGEVSVRSDVYSAGVLGFELLTGIAPFQGSVEDLVLKHRNEPFPAQILLDRGIDPAIADILERATHKRTVMRYKDASYLRNALRDATKDLSAKDGARAFAVRMERIGRAQDEPIARSAEIGSSDYYAMLSDISETKRQEVEKQRQSGSATAESARPTAVESASLHASLTDVDTQRFYTVRHLFASGIGALVIVIVGVVLLFAWGLVSALVSGFFVRGTVLSVILFLVAFVSPIVLGVLGLLRGQKSRVIRAATKIAQLAGPGGFREAAEEIVGCILMSRTAMVADGIRESTLVLAKQGYSGATIRACPSRVADPVAPLMVPFEPLPLDETDTRFREIADAESDWASTAAPVGPKSRRRGFPWTLFAFRPSLPVNYILIGLIVFMAILSFFPLIRIGFYAGPLDVILLSLLFMRQRGLRNGMSSWWLVPGHLVRRDTHLWRRHSSIRVYDRRSSVLWVYANLEGTWGFAVADGRTRSGGRARAAEIRMLLRTWLSPVPPPDRDQLERLLGKPQDGSE